MTLVLAFLQNMWVKDPQGTQEFLEKHPELRERMIRTFLFMGCLTGRRIKNCFADVLDHITFEEASLDIAGDSRTICFPNHEHIRFSLEKYRPKVVLTFGKVATEAVRSEYLMWTQFGRIKGQHFISCPHPAARQIDTVTKLNVAAAQIKKIQARSLARTTAVSFF